MIQHVNPSSTSRTDGKTSLSLLTVDKKSAFPLAEAATVMDRIERRLDGNFPDEFSGDAVALNPEMAPTPVTEPSLVLFWCCISPSGELTPAKSFLEQTTQAGRVLGNTVTETIPAA
ncbi:hypothetical protein AARAC_001838 [Aspergillus arachidicola]|uniref:Uncharacterized protein n=1 Tax=Aspergillus arachidicola TaxID=656916 RepID=A0A2G7FVJ4_9EURO|nr:hypothetical protein AARAC_001838 [Aspergillus arachidicola]